MAAIAFGLVAIGIATALVLQAFQKNLVFFFSPTQVAAKEAPLGRIFRIGGIVVPGSVKRDGVEVRFAVTDMAKTIPVVYRGAPSTSSRAGHRGLPRVFNGTAETREAVWTMMRTDTQPAKPPTRSKRLRSRRRRKRSSNDS